MNTQTQTQTQTSVHVVHRQDMDAITIEQRLENGRVVRGGKVHALVTEYVTQVRELTADQVRNIQRINVPARYHMAIQQFLRTGEAAPVSSSTTSLCSYMRPPITGGTPECALAVHAISCTHCLKRLPSYPSCGMDHWERQAMNTIAMGRAIHAEAEQRGTERSAAADAVWSLHQSALQNANDTGAEKGIPHGQWYGCVEFWDVYLGSLSTLLSVPRCARARSARRWFGNRGVFA